MAPTRTEDIGATDGSGTFAGTVTLPAGGSGPGLMLLQEIFGVNDYIVDVARRLAELGYVTLAPDLFWRQEPGVALGHDQAALEKGMSLAQRFDGAKGAEDLGAALAHLRSLPEVRGGAGAIGFCFGGVMAYLTAAVADPDVAVAYYGSGVPDLLAMADQVACPILFHFGTADAFLPSERAEEVRAVFESRPDAEVRVHEGAGHAFDNSFAPQFSQPEHAEVAWGQTVAFLRRYLPVPQPVR
ncbi:MAG: dienelactone hydrolase family protein [Acidimicrobiales bacterium]